jgi:hypothetical protein
MTDAERLDEFKWVVQQMNVFLSKTRAKLLSCKDMEAMIEVLGLSFTPSGKTDLSARRSLVYQKLKQQWVRTEIARVRTMMIQDMETEEQDG